MIAYEVLVQTIADWKAGVRPTAPTPAAAPQQVEELSSGVVDFDDEVSFSAEDDDEAQLGYDQSEYEQPAETYDSPEHQHEYQEPAETYDSPEHQHEYQEPAETYDSPEHHDYQQPTETYDDDER